MWKAIFESSFTGKILLGALVCLLVWFMQFRLERVQAELAQKEEQCIVLLNANKKQQETITRLVQEQAKQEKILMQAEQERQILLQKYQTKQKQVYKSTDKKSTDWKQSKIPESVLQILKK